MPFRARTWLNPGPKSALTSITVGDIFAPTWPGAPTSWVWTVTSITPNAVTGNALLDHDDPNEIESPGPTHFTMTLSGTGAPSGSIATFPGPVRRLSAVPQWPLDQQQL